MRLAFPSNLSASVEDRWSVVHWIAFIGLAALCYLGARSTWNNSEPPPVEATLQPASMATSSAPAPRPPVPTNQAAPLQTNRNSESRTPTNSTSIPPRSLEPVLTNRLVRVTNELPQWVESLETNAIPDDSGGSTNFASRPVENTYEAQLVLASQGISSGPIDGMMGSQTRAAIRALQERDGLEVNGLLDTETRRRLWLRWEPYEEYTVTEADLARLGEVPSTWLGKSQKNRLPYQTILELVAEEGWAYESYVQRLNPDIVWTNVVPGTKITIPNVKEPLLRSKAAEVQIILNERILKAYDANGRLLIHFPCSIARRVDKRPSGVLRVEKLASNPQYRFDPEIFPESQEAQELGRVLTIPPGPNNPVGLVWIGLSLPGYGIHGTPEPELVGRTESHGCFRLSNWNAQILLKLVEVGTPVVVKP